MEIILLSNPKQSSKLSDQEQRLFSSQYLCLLGNVSKKLSLHQIVSGPFCQSESGYTMPKTQEHCSNM